jgi:hypothetical protein
MMMQRVNFLLLEAIWGLHSSTSQLNVSICCGLHTSTPQCVVSTFGGLGCVLSHKNGSGC